MVLWELTAMTAYFLGLKRTYRLALRLQRRLIPPNHPRIRDFVYRRTRDVFNVAVSVHKNIQQRDIEVGRNLGSMILRWLDRMKPSAQIRPHPPVPPNGNSERFRHLSTTNRTVGSQKTTSRTSAHDSSGKMLFSPLNIRSKPFPVLPTMMQPTRISASSQCRRISYSSSPSGTAKRKDLIEGVFRRDIAQLMISVLHTTMRPRGRCGKLALEEGKEQCMQTCMMHWLRACQGHRTKHHQKATLLISL